VGRKHLVSLEECEKEGFPRTLGTPNALDDRARKPEEAKARSRGQNSKLLSRPHFSGLWGNRPPSTL